MSQQLRLVLMGQTGVGKSSLGNTILNQRVFRSSSQGSSTTKLCQLRDGYVKNRRISVVDTPGYMDTETENQGDILNEIERSILLSSPGPHVICYVVQIGRFTAENVKTFKALVKHFGEDFYKYVIVVFTRFDDFKRDCDEDEKDCDIKNYIYTLPYIVFDFIVNKCRSRVIGIDNTLKGADSRDQVNELLRLVDQICIMNDSAYYSMDAFARAQAKIQAKAHRKKLEREWEERFEKRHFDREVEEAAERKAEEERRRLRRNIMELNNNQGHDEDNGMLDAILFVAPIALSWLFGSR